MFAAFAPAARTFAAAACSVALTAAAQAPVLFDSTPAPASEDTAWSAIYRTDLDALLAYISANHPGPVDSRNADFARTLTSAYDEAVRDTSRIASYDSYAIALARFGNRLQDAHLTVAGARRPGELREAGIYTVYRGGGFMVADVDARYGMLAPALLGATVLGCGPLDVRQVFATRVLSWRGRPTVEADWFRWAPLLFTDHGPPTPPGPSTCRFAIADRTVELPLQWTSADAAAVLAKQVALTSLVTRPVGVERHNDGRTIWANLPAFAADGAMGPADRPAFLDSLRTALRATPKWSLLVFDLRGNHGGSSRWGVEIARVVLGERWSRQAQAWLEDGVYAEWRVSHANLQAIDQILEQIGTANGADAGAKRMRALRDSMAAGLARGDSLLGTKRRRRNVKKPEPTKLSGRIVVLTSADCSGSCLDFLDRMLLHPAVIHAGQTTGVDSDYHEIRGLQLPSGLASVNYPMKVHRNRRREHNAAYTPDFPYEGNINDTQTLREWIVRNCGTW